MPKVLGKKQLKEYEKAQKQKAKPDDVKMIKYSAVSKAALLVTDNEITMQSDEYDVSIGSDYGVIINGPVGYTNFWHKMKYGGTYRGNPMVHSNIPSTINTPIPLFIWDFPYENIKALYLNNIVKNIIEGLL